MKFEKGLQRLGMRDKLYLHFITFFLQAVENRIAG